jgi:DNA end-binding protein Ku
MKSVWKGYLGFGLVQFPVSLYSAIEPKTFNFRILCGKCKTPLHYKRWCKKCNKEIEWQKVIKGIEIGKGKIIPLTKETLEKLKPEKSDLIEIIEFIDNHQIDPIYFNTHYFLVPQTQKEKAYFLFKDVLQATNKIAIAKFIMREKEHICAIRSYKKGLLLSTLNYSYEVRDINEIETLKTSPRLNKEELKLAKQIIDKFYEQEFNITNFKDTFAEKLKETLKKLEKGEKIIIKKKPKKEKTLIQALKATLSE